MGKFWQNAKYTTFEENAHVCHFASGIVFGVRLNDFNAVHDYSYLVEVESSVEFRKMQHILINSTEIREVLLAYTIM